MSKVEIKTDKRIICEFHGGYWDGKTLDSSDKDQAFWARGYYSITNGGQKGKGFYGLASDSAENLAKIGFDKGWMGDGSTHQYTVFGRLETESEILIQFEYSVRPPSGKPKAK